MPLDQPNEHDPSNDPDEYRSDYDDQRYDGPSNDHTMPLGDHLDELRGRIIKMLIGVVIALVVTIYFGFQIVGWLAQPLLHAQDITGLSTTPIQTDPTAGFTSVYLRVVLIAAVILAAPWIIWQAWQFIVVGLYEHEKKAVHILAPFSTIMTFLAVLFTYYILLPISLLFFLNFVNFYPVVELTSDPPWITRQAASAYVDDSKPERPDDFVYATQAEQIPIFETRPENPKEGTWWINDDRGRIEIYFDGKVSVIAERSTKLITPLPAMNEYIRFATFMMLGSVIAFQLPVVMLVLGWTQLFDPRGIQSIRKYALFVCFALGALLTPADPLSMLVLAIPLYLLFEFGLVLMKLTFKKRENSMPADL
ncbi:MAG: twin-arginine translocase subunit TatC [Planctomycetota bacterium]